MSDFKTSYSNLFIYYKLAQSGKTTIIEDSIHKDEDKMLEEVFYEAEEILDVLDLTVESCKTIYANIIITANNLLLANQTYERLSEFMNGEIFEMSSKKSSFTYIVSNIALKNKDGLPICRNVICCSNKVQFNNISTLIAMYLSNKIKVNVYCDEIDKYWSQIKCIIKKYPDAIFYGLSATINKKMFDDQGGSMLFIHQDICHGPDYVGYRDHEIVPIKKQNNIECIDEIITEITDEITDEITGEMDKNTNILIIPGRTNEEHRDIAYTCLLLGTLPIIINQHGIIMYKNKSKRGSIDLKKIYQNKELCDVLKNLRKDYNITVPIVVIGSSVCAGRGITHQSEQFLYDYGIILQNPTNKIEIYQTVSRLAHNFKYLNKKCKVYITEANDKIARECEDKIYKINEMSGSKPEITYKEFKKAGKQEIEDKYEHVIEEFKKLEEALFHIKQVGGIKPNALKMNEKGFYLSSYSGISEVLSYDIKDKILNGKSTANMSIGNGRLYTRLYVTYLDTTDKNSVVYLVRVVKEKS